MQPQPPPGSSNNPSDPTGAPQDGQPQDGYPQGQYEYPQQGHYAADQAGYPQQGELGGYPQPEQPKPWQAGYPQADPTAQIPQGYPLSDRMIWGPQASYPQPDQGDYQQQEESFADPATHWAQAPEQAAYPGQPSYPQGQSVPGGGYGPNAYPQAPVRIPGAPGPSPDGAASPGFGASAARTGRRILSGAGTVAGLAAVVGVIYLGSWGCHQINKPDAEKVQEGQCVKVAGSTSDPKVDITDCDSVDANYKVVEREDKSTAPCPDENDTSVWQTGSGGYNLCLQLNVQTGDCLNKQFDHTIRVLCDSSEANYKVTDVLQNTTSDRGCDNSASKYLTYAKPEEMVVCLSVVD